MKLSLISIAAVFALCDAQDDADHRKRPHKMGGSGGGGGGKLGDKLGDMIETKCSDPNTCFGVVPADLDCTFQEPEKPDTTGMDVDKRNQVKREYRAKKKECKENMVKCACCAGMSVEDIIAAKGDNGGSRPSGGGGGAGGRPGKGGDGFFGKESGGAKLQNMIETECDNPSTCDMVDDPTTLDCTFEMPDRPDMSELDEDAKAQLKEELKAKMKERYQDMAKCVCCAGTPIEDIMAAAHPLGGGSDGKPGGRPGGMGGFGGGFLPQGGGEGEAGGGRPGKGGDGFFGKESGGAKLQNMIETECDNPSTCDMVDDPTTLDCTFEMPDRPDMSELDEDAKAQLKEELKAKMKERYQDMAKCVCCAGTPIEDITAAAHPLGGGSDGKPGGRPGGMGGFGGGFLPQGGGKGEAGGGRPGKGGGGLFEKESDGAKLQSMIDTECDNPSTCDMVDDPTTLDCTFETPDLPDMSGVDGDAKAQLKEELEAAMKERYQSMAKCVCCAGMPFEDIMAATRPLGGGSGGKPGGRPGGKPGGMGGFGGGNRPQGGSEGMDIQAKLDEACSGDDVAQKCDEISSQAVDCSRFDSMMDNIESIMGSNIRGGRRKNVFYCGCCRDLP